MHAHGTFSVSHPGSFLKTLWGMRVDRELVRSRWQLSTVYDGSLSAVRGSRARSSVKIQDCEEHEEEQEEEHEECEEHEEEHEEHEEECEEHEQCEEREEHEEHEQERKEHEQEHKECERDSHSSHSSPSLQYNRREDQVCAWWSYRHPDVVGM